MLSKTDWIKSQLMTGESSSDAASRLNSITIIPNPTPRAQVSKPIDLIALRASIPDIEAFKVLSNPIWDRITDAIKIGDLVTISYHMAALLAGNLISPATVAIVAPILQQTQLDPNWQATIAISPARLAGFDLVLVDEVENAISQ